MARRSYGSGSLFVRSDAAGVESWYGSWWSDGRRVKRKLGAKRPAGSRDGLTRAQAEAEMRRRIEATQVVLNGYGIELAEAGARYIAHLETVLERKPTTIQDYRIILKLHLVDYFEERSLASINAESVAGYLRFKRRQGVASNTVRNQLNFLHGLFGFALKRGWVASNPVAAVDRPSLNGTDPDIRYLSAEQVDSLLAAVPKDRRGPTDRVLYMTAAMCGLRQGELVALRWRDVDFKAGLIRVRRSFTRGRFSTPKSRRSSRGVPMPSQLATELRGHLKRSHYKGEDDLVFCQPDSGNPYDPSKMRRRFKAAITAAKVGQFEDIQMPDDKVKRVPLTRFHDLRHTYGTRMAAAGAPLRNIQEWMGHSDYKTTSIYADFALDPAQDARWAEAAFGDSDSDEEKDQDEDADAADG
jgi:integrase